jgi:hypothetical protein
LLCAGAFQLDATTSYFIFDRYGAGALDFGSGDHAASLRPKSRLELLFVKFIGA